MRHPQPGGDILGRAGDIASTARWVVLVAVAAYLVRGCWVTVGAGERAVIFNKFSGVQQMQHGEGWRFLIPLLQQATIYDVKTATYTMSGVTGEGDVKGDDAMTALTSDGQTVALDMSVRYHIDPENVWRLHQTLGPEYRTKVIRPQARSHTRMVVSAFKVTDVYSGRRALIQEQVKQRLAKSFKESHIILDDVLLRDVKFSPAFQQAIEQKQVALQDAQAMEYHLDQARKERDRKVIEAEGSAESIRLKAQALAQNPQLVQYEYVQKLPADVRTAIVDSKTILNLGDLFGAAPARPAEAAR